MALAACSAEQRSGNVVAADINAAAADAQGDIDTYAANTLQAAVTATPMPKALPSAPPPVREVAAASTLRPAADPAPDQIAETSDPNYRCGGETRVSVRDDTRPADVRDAASGSRAVAGVWTKSDGQDLRADRTASDRLAAAGCSVN